MLPKFKMEIPSLRRGVGVVGTVQDGWLQTGREGGEEEEEEGSMRGVFLEESNRPLPVLQFSRHPLGDAAAQQPHQEEDAHTQRHHQQDVVLGGRRHHLYRQVREALGRRHLQDKWTERSGDAVRGNTPVAP